MGRIAVSLLLRLLENRRGERMSIELQTRLIVRDSTAPPAISRISPALGANPA
jgi:DNA-binding LacI/PurR family transcriptional regulator